MRTTIRFIHVLVILAVMLGASVNAQSQTTISSGSNVITTTPGVAITAASGTPDVTVRTGDNTATSAFHIFNLNSELLRVQSNGSVGIGTTNPNFRLQVAADGAGLWPADNGNGQLVLTGASDPTKRLGFMIDTTSNVGVIAAEHYLYAPYNLALQPGGGNVGIGSMTPNSRLQVTADGTGTWPADNGVGQVVLTGATDTTKRLGLMIDTTNNVGVIAAEHYQFGPYNLALQPGGGNVGIGLTNPSEKLSVAGTIQTSVGVLFPDGLQKVAYPFDANSNTSDLNRSTAGLVTSSVTNSTGPASIAATGGNGIAYVRLSSTATPAKDWRIGIVDATGFFKVRDNNVSGAAGDLMTINGSAIHFNGNVDGTTIQATYQDVAEWVPTAKVMVAGTVVVVSEDVNNTVTPSIRAYDTSVAGVVSANPGLLLGVAGTSKAKIATTGRVRVRVDATKSPIHKGDLLVTSDRPGMAMKSEPLDLGGVKIHRPGTLIGKALEPLARGEGEILVLLSLQ